jgi:hypothetical protein
MHAAMELGMPFPNRDRRSNDASLDGLTLARSVGMKRKVDQLSDAWNSGDQIAALRIAARFFDRSADAKTFKRGMDAHNNPAFYQQIGKEPEQLIKTALSVLARRFGPG